MIKWLFWLGLISLLGGNLLGEETTIEITTEVQTIVDELKDVTKKWVKDNCTGDCKEKIEAILNPDKEVEPEIKKVVSESKKPTLSFRNE